MTDEQLREAVARAIYEQVKADFLADPVTVSMPDGFAENVFPAWEKTNQKPYLANADAATALLRPVYRAEALEEAAQVADEYGEFDRKLIADAEDDEERAAFERGAFKGRNIAAAIRALKEKPNE